MADYIHTHPYGSYPERDGLDNSNGAKLVHDNKDYASNQKYTECDKYVCNWTHTKHDCLALHAKYGLPPHRMTSKSINDITNFGADRSKWLHIKENDKNYGKKRVGSQEAVKAMKRKLAERDD